VDAELGVHHSEAVRRWPHLARADRVIKGLSELGNVRSQSVVIFRHGAGMEFRAAIGVEGFRRRQRTG